MEYTPTRELDAPKSEVDGGKIVEWVDTQNGKGYYKQPEEKIDEEMKQIRKILGGFKLIGVNYFPNQD